MALTSGAKEAGLVEEFAWRASNKRCEETDPDVANDNQSALSCDLPLCCLFYLAIDELGSPCSTQARSNCSRSHTFLASRQIIHKANHSAVYQIDNLSSTAPWTLITSLCGFVI